MSSSIFWAWALHSRRISPNNVFRGILSFQDLYIDFFFEMLNGVILLLSHFLCAILEFYLKCVIKYDVLTSQSFD